VSELNYRAGVGGFWADAGSVAGVLMSVAVAISLSVW